MRRMHAIRGPTEALRANSPELLRVDLLKALVRYEREAREQPPDNHNIMWTLAPYHDCARRLGLDPAAFFQRVADECPPRFSDLVREFGLRTDTAPESFGGYGLIDTPEGPSYIWR